MQNADNEKKSYYAIIPADVRYDERLKPNAKLLYGEVTALCNEKGYCWANNSYFSKLYKVKQETISRWISQLYEYKYIKIEIIQEAGNQRRIRLNEHRRHSGVLIKKSRPHDKKGKHNITNNNKAKQNKIITNKQLEAAAELARIEMLQGKAK